MLDNSKRAARFILICATLSALSCSKHVPLAVPAAPLSKPTHLCAKGEAPPRCRNAAQFEKLFEGKTELLSLADTPSGSQGAKLLTLRSEEHGHSVVFRAKWRPQSSSGLINEPRKELAAYAVQKLFLDASELVAPPTVAHCFPVEEYRRFVPDEPTSFKDIDCVFGFASYWLEEIKTIGEAREEGLLHREGIWDPALFERDPGYRSSISRANLLTYVINHGDAHDEQFMLEQKPRGLRAYVVDNSIAFRSIKNPMLLFREDWSKIQVVALPEPVLSRLRKLTNDDFARLGTVSELELDHRQLRQVSEKAARVKSDGTAISWQGSRLRIGLTSGEIDLVSSRVHALLARTDLKTFAEP